MAGAAGPPTTALWCNECGMSEWVSGEWVPQRTLPSYNFGKTIIRFFRNYNDIAAHRICRASVHSCYVFGSKVVFSVAGRMLEKLRAGLSSGSLKQSPLSAQQSVSEANYLCNYFRSNANANPTNKSHSVLSVLVLLAALHLGYSWRHNDVMCLTRAIDRLRVFSSDIANDNLINVVGLLGQGALT